MARISVFRYQGLIKGKKMLLAHFSFSFHGVFRYTLCIFSHFAYFELTNFGDVKEANRGIFSGTYSWPLDVKRKVVFKRTEGDKLTRR